MTPNSEVRNLTAAEIERVEGGFRGEDVSKVIELFRFVTAPSPTALDAASKDACKMT